MYKHDFVLLKANSGYGKSSLLYLLAGLVPRIIFATFHGEVLFYNQVINKLSINVRLKIALVLQNPAHNIINRTVYLELAFGLENLSLDPLSIKQQIITIANKYKITQLLYRNINHLSFGEKQKIAIIAQLLLNSEVILLDEPTAFLDQSSIKSLIDFLIEIKDDKTIIIAEHNWHYFNELITKVLVINNNYELCEGVVTYHSTTVSSYHINQDSYLSYNLINNSYNNNYQHDNQSIILQINNLKYSYNANQLLLNNINLIVKAKAIVGIMGDNGCGKSTLLQIIAGIIKSQDQVFFCNIEINKISKKSLYNELGLLMQNPEQHFLYNSVIEELNHNEELLILLSLEAQKYQNPFTLSIGQQRRLSFGSILANKSTFKLLLLDEPNFALDDDQKQNLIQLINIINNRYDTAFIIVSHDPEFLLQLCSQVITIPKII